MLTLIFFVLDSILVTFTFIVWPIESNSEVKFYVWDADGFKNTTYMEVGTCWYLDIRKPHQAINNGVSDRIHLVVDIEANEEVRCKL